MKKSMTLVSLLALSISAFAAEYPVLTTAGPDTVGFDLKKLNKLDDWIQNQISAGYPSINLLIVKDNHIVYQKAWGYAKKYEGSLLMAAPISATTATMYDLASNTKMFATNFALQKLVYEKKIDVNDLVSQYIPGFADRPGDSIRGKDALRITDILHHTAGFPADPQYPNKKAAGALYSQNKATTLEMIKKTPLDYVPGTKHIYSDVDYMILGFIIESVVQMPLDTYVENSIYKPLGLTHTVFNPLQKGFSRQQIAATELNGNTRDGVITFPNIRTSTIWGQVHDEKAWYAMGGVSGHAGLFSTTSDMAVLMQVMLNDGGYGNVKLFDKNTVAQFTRGSAQDATFGLGWRVNGNASMTPTFGVLASAQTYGHTGWTGTLTAIDPVNHMAIVILGNKPHSPVADPKMNPNVFMSGLLPAATYGWIVDQVYGALKP
ncbi:penicillin binding protein PBP4B [[Enterobacter] lignolyticus]|uniref:Putative D-alanyl-D-alanine carboxypeptidase n=1 Tax=Enterobacter lignolyticus (strain SCF1) TaxID=701347 RepID=E3GAL8_ENTLS|nr:penicillin binding protein PBP4B [[Enterobacter] lignolyticus]ADO48851.1 beta-lactamase [[Enterobacter] lignolyticus SCF1]